MNLTFQLIRGEKEESYAAFSKRIFDFLEVLQKNEDIIDLKVTLTEEKPPLLSIIPFGKSKIAAIRMGWHQLPASNPLENARGASGAYQVEEAIPVAYTIDWTLATRTPGVCLLTLFRKKKSIDRALFLDRWHNGHTPLSLEIHPLWHYSRNVITASWGRPTTPSFDGIVEEHCTSRNKMMNPINFFGGFMAMIPNMISVYRDVNSFLDYSSIEPFLVAEYIIKSRSTA